MLGNTANVTPQEQCLQPRATLLPRADISRAALHDSHHLYNVQNKLIYVSVSSHNLKLPFIANNRVMSSQQPPIQPQQYVDYLAAHLHIHYEVSVQFDFCITQTIL